MSHASQKPFTGKHMAAILISGFGIVMVVNFTMASLAVSGFHGTVVDNSYVASQKFNTWLEEAAKADALGWQVDAVREPSGHVRIDTSGVPQGAVIRGELRRPLGAHDRAALSFVPMGEGAYRSDQPVTAGRWTMRLLIEADGHHWASEGELGQ